MNTRYKYAILALSVNTTRASQDGEEAAALADAHSTDALSIAEIQQQVIQYQLNNTDLDV